MNKFKVTIFSFILITSGFCYAGPDGHLTRLITNDPTGKKAAVADVFERHEDELLLDSFSKIEINAILSKLAEKYGDDPEVLGNLLVSKSEKDIPAQIDILMTIYGKNSISEETTTADNKARFFESLIRDDGFLEILASTDKEDMAYNFSVFEQEEKEDAELLTKRIEKELTGKDILKEVGANPTLYSDINIQKILTGAKRAEKVSKEKTLLEMAKILINTKRELGKDVSKIESAYKRMKTHLENTKDRAICIYRIYKLYDNDERVLHNGLEYSLDALLNDNHGFKTLENSNDETAVLGTPDREFKDGLLYQLQKDNSYSDPQIKRKALSLSVELFTKAMFSTAGNDKIINSFMQMIRTGNLKPLFKDLSELNFYGLDKNIVLKSESDELRRTIRNLRSRVELERVEIK